MVYKSNPSWRLVAFALVGTGFLWGAWITRAATYKPDADTPAVHVETMNLGRRYSPAVEAWAALIEEEFDDAISTTGR